MIKKRRLPMTTIIMSAALLLVLNAVNTRAAAADNSSEVKIEAEGTIDYDIDRNLTTATKKVRLSNADILIECEKLVYDANSGQADASGGVKLTNKNGVYQTAAITYNVKQQAGSFGQFTGVIDGQSRDYQVSGAKVDLKGDSGEINYGNYHSLSKASYRIICSLPSGSHLKVTGFNYRQTTFSIKRVKVLYLPSFTFNIKEKFSTRD